MNRLGVNNIFPSFLGFFGFFEVVSTFAIFKFEKELVRLKVVFSNKMSFSSEVYSDFL